MKHRRWFQFSLRTLFIAMFVAMIWPAHYANRLYRQRKAIEAIELKGGEVRVKSDGTIDYVFIPNFTAGDVERLSHLPQVRSLMMSSGVFDSSMAPLSRVTGIESVVLADMKATWDGLKVLVALPGLQHLRCRRVVFNEPNAPAGLIGCAASDITFEDMNVEERCLKPLCAAMPKCMVSISSSSGHSLHRSRIIRP